MRTEIIVLGSIVGTRKDFEEALGFRAEVKVKAAIERQPIESIKRYSVGSDQVR